MKRSGPVARRTPLTCGRSDVKLDAAHVLARAQVTPGVGENPLNVIPLCERCHAAQHGHTLELLPVLTLDEQAHLAGLVGIARAYRLTTHRLDAGYPAGGSTNGKTA